MGEFPLFGVPAVLVPYPHAWRYQQTNANFLEKQTGSIEVGKRADLIVLEENLFKIPSNEIAKTNVLLTLVDGEIAYIADAFTEFIE